MNVYMICLIDVVYDLLIPCKVLLEITSYILQVCMLMEDHYVNIFLNDY